MTGVYAAVTGVMAIVGAMLVVALTVQAREPLIFAGLLWLLSGLLGLYSAWALLGGKM
jgi:disulfide bond formation protein DsbB